jgi:hypothetical protein
MISILLFAPWPGKMRIENPGLTRSSVCLRWRPQDTSSSSTLILRGLTLTERILSCVPFLGGQIFGFQLFRVRYRTALSLWPHYPESAQLIILAVRHSGCAGSDRQDGRVGACLCFSCSVQQWSTHLRHAASRKIRYLCRRLSWMMQLYAASARYRCALLNQLMVLAQKNDIFLLFEQ